MTERGRDLPQQRVRLCLVQAQIRIAAGATLNELGLSQDTPSAGTVSLSD